MSFVMRNKFWIGVGLAVVILLVLHLVLVVPRRGEIVKNIEELDDSQGTLETIKNKGKRVATEPKIEGCKKTGEVLETQYTRVVEFFHDRRKEVADYWSEVLAPDGRVQPAMFKEMYKDETAALEKKMKRMDIEVTEGAFEWVDFGERVPSRSECLPVMMDFRILEHIAGLIMEAKDEDDTKAVTQIDSIKLGDKEAQDIVLISRDVAFYSRPLTIEANVLYSKILFLIDKLHQSDKNIIARTLSIKQAEGAMAKKGQEVPVSVLLNCMMLQRGEKPKGE